jgi:hypothetical protein
MEKRLGVKREGENVKSQCPVRRKSLQIAVHDTHIGAKFVWDTG